MLNGFYKFIGSSLKISSSLSTSQDDKIIAKGKIYNNLGLGIARLCEVMAVRNCCKWLLLCGL